MRFSPSQALLGLLPALIPSALGALASGTNDTTDGIYSTKATNTTTEITPSLVARSMGPEASNLLCYKQKHNCKYKDVYQEKAELYAASMCKKQEGAKGEPGWEGTWAWDRNRYWVSYNMKVEWIYGCKLHGGDGTQDVVNPGHGITCFDLLFQTWINCNNGGRGGTIEFGCLKYYYNIINGDQAGPGYCVNLPYDNSTLGGGY